jgi:hypothetical protein
MRAGVPQDFLNTEANLNAHERRQWRMRMEGTTNPPTSTTDAPKTSAAANDFVSDRDLDDLFELSVLTAQENDWEPETREEFEQHYHEEIVGRNSKVSG